MGKKKKDKKAKAVEEDDFDALLDEADDLLADDEEEDEFDRLLREADDDLYSEDDPKPEPVATEVPLCEETGQHELDGTSTCIHCLTKVEAEPEVVVKRGKRNPGEPRQPRLSGHCQSPQTENPIESHLRCQRNGGGDRAVPDKVFAPCPCHCHVEVAEYECSLCGGVIRPAPHWTGEWIDPEDLDLVTFVHVIQGRAQEECP